jgi:hypothetical protein
VVEEEDDEEEDEEEDLALFFFGMLCDDWFRKIFILPSHTTTERFQIQDKIYGEFQYGG